MRTWHMQAWIHRNDGTEWTKEQLDVFTDALIAAVEEQGCVINFVASDADSVVLAQSEGPIQFDRVMSESP